MFHREVSPWVTITLRTAGWIWGQIKEGRWRGKETEKEREGAEREKNPERLREVDFLPSLAELEASKSLKAGEKSGCEVGEGWGNWAVNNNTAKGFVRAMLGLTACPSPSGPGGWLWSCWRRTSWRLVEERGAASGYVEPTASVIYSGLKRSDNPSSLKIHSAHAFPPLWCSVTHGVFANILKEVTHCRGFLYLVGISHIFFGSFYAYVEETEWQSWGFPPGYQFYAKRSGHCLLHSSSVYLTDKKQPVFALDLMGDRGEVVGGPTLNWQMITQDSNSLGGFSIGGNGI